MGCRLFLVEAAWSCGSSDVRGPAPGCNYLRARGVSCSRTLAGARTHAHTLLNRQAAEERG